MKTPTYRPVLRALAAAAVALAGSSLAVPALAQDTADPAAPTATAAPADTGISDAGLAEAVRRDLGMTLEQFNAAGAQAKRAADAVRGLRELPGYVGIRLQDGKTVVEGAGADLQVRVAELNQAGPDEFTLQAPAPLSAAAGAGTAVDAGAGRAGLVAGSADQLFEAYVRDVGPAGLQAVAFADGHFIIRTGGVNTPEGSTAESAGDAAAPAQQLPGKVSPADFVARYANVALEKGAPIKTEDDYFGGQGFVIDDMAICSAGFGGFDAAGLPLVLTAGHCAEDGQAVRADVEPGTAAPAGGATNARPAVPGLLGTFGFSQFGGPGNSPITGSENRPGNIGTDIAVIKDIRAGLAMQPSVTRWDSPAAPGRSSVKIIGAAAPYQGQSVCRSGRTEGWSCGVVAETGIYVAAGRPTPGTACTDAGGVPLEPCTLRAFKGFLSYDVQSSGGDSGGPWISGNYAVGTHSAGEPAGAEQNFAVAATLQDALRSIPGGVELQVFLNKPTLAAKGSAAAVAPGSLVRGRVAAAPASAVAAGSKVRLVRDKAEPVEVPVDADGNWSFAAPAKAGSFRYTAETVNGHSRSGALEFTLRVESEAGAAAAGMPAARPAAGLPVLAPAPRPGAVMPAAPAASAMQAGQAPAATPAASTPPAATAAPTAPAVTPTPARGSTEASNPADASRTPSAGQQPGTAAGSFLPLAGLAGGALVLAAAVLVGAHINRRRGAR
ncbi:S1 family peptidase [Arthrobacter sp. Hor0625]|uniref:S1 family peptidase n=1 Tax=Arthrobacter sp. Hor0625 TaxID=3457358 RepID=UPI00403EB177